MELPGHLPGFAQWVFLQGYSSANNLTCIIFSEISCSKLLLKYFQSGAPARKKFKKRRKLGVEGNSGQRKGIIKGRRTHPKTVEQRT